MSQEGRCGLRVKRVHDDREVDGSNLGPAKSFSKNFSLFAKSEAFFTFSQQREGGSQGRMSVLNLVKKCQRQMLNIIMYANSK